MTIAVGVLVVFSFFCLSCPISLPSVFEPVADLCGRESRGLGQLSFLPWGWVRIVGVPLPKDAPTLLFEAVACLLSVPDGAGQGELSSDAILSYGAEWTTPQLFRLDVVRFQPKLLQFRVVVRRKLVALQDLVELSEVAPVESNHGFCFEDAFVFVEVLARRQGPEKSPQPLDVPPLLEDFTNTRHLFLRKTKRRKHGHGDNVNQDRLYCALLPRSVSHEIKTH